MTAVFVVSAGGSIGAQGQQKARKASSDVLTQVRESDYGEGMPGYREIVSNTYDDRGNLTGTVNESDWNADGTADSRTVTTKAYDKRGNEIETVFQWYSGADGVPGDRTTITRTYDRQGRLLRMVYEADRHGDGVIDYSEPTTITYDQHGNATTRIDKGWAHIVITRRYDTRGRLLTRVEEWDVNWPTPIDGTADFRNSTTNVYDGKGNLLTTLTDGDFWDSGDDWFDRRTYQTTNTYDRSGNVLTTVSTDNYNGQRSWTNVYDRQGNLSRQVEEYDGDVDGVPDHRLVTTNSYDRRGNLKAALREEDYDADGMIDYRATTTNAYDGRGYVSTRVVDYVWTWGTARETTTYTRDAFGNMLTEIVEYDREGDGTADVRHTYTRTYRR